MCLIETGLRYRLDKQVRSVHGVVPAGGRVKGKWFIVSRLGRRLLLSLAVFYPLLLDGSREQCPRHKRTSTLWSALNTSRTEWDEYPRV